MHSPTSYQIPPIEASLNTTSLSIPSLDLVPPPKQPHSIPSKRKAVSSPSSLKSKPTINLFSSPNSAATKITTSLSHLRKSYKATAEKHLAQRAEALSSALTTLASTHQTRMEQLTSINTDLHCFALGNTRLDFKDATGQDKGSAMLEERMDFFEAKVVSIRALIKGLVLEWEKVESEIEGVCGELRDVLEDGEESEMMEHAEEARRMVEKIVDCAVEAWEEMEGKFEREKAMHREGLLKLYGEGSA